MPARIRSAEPDCQMRRLQAMKKTTRTTSLLAAVDLLRFIAAHQSVYPSDAERKGWAK